MSDDGLDVVIGIGNRMRNDDAAGPFVLDKLAGRLAPGVHLVESRGDPVTLLGWWQSAARAVVVDAVRSGGKPGTIYRFNGDTPLPARYFRQSTHLVGLADAVEMARTLGRLPRSFVLFGIEAESFDHGTRLSPAVAEASLAVIESIVDLFGMPGTGEFSTKVVGGA